MASDKIIEFNADHGLARAKRNIRASRLLLNVADEIMEKPRVRDVERVIDLLLEAHANLETILKNGWLKE